jgi:DNA-3-methyladenine glycosylase I
MIQYHDEEWGIPVHNDKKLFEMLILEGAQAGLSWSTILKRRKTYRIAFDNFDPKKISKYTQKDVTRLLSDEGIIRNRLKIKSAINNAQRFLEIQKEFGSFDQYLWGFVGGKPIKNNFAKLADIPASTPLSDQISKDLKKREFSFVGSTIIYAYLQAVGVVDDHTKNCFRH